MARIIIVCCVCKSVYGEKDSEGSIGGASHGYCDCCFAEEMKALTMRKAW